MRHPSLRRIEAHPKTGAVQIVEVRERVEEIGIPAVDGRRLARGADDHLLRGRADGVQVGWTAGDDVLDTDKLVEDQLEMPIAFHVVVRDRQHLAEDGFVIVVVAVDSNGKLIRDPEIITRGLVHVDASQDVLDEVRQLLVGMFDESPADELRDSPALTLSHIPSTWSPPRPPTCRPPSS